MLQAGTDFKCERKNNVFICAANSQSSLELFKALQNKIRLVATEMAKHRSDVPGDLVTISPDGRIGPTTVIGVQTVLAVLNRTNPLPPELFPLLSIQASSEQTIERVAATADGILIYIDQTLLNFPDALKMPTTFVMQRVPWLKVGTQHLVAGAGILALVLGLGAVAFARHRRDNDHEESDRLPDDDEEDDE